MARLCRPRRLSRRRHLLRPVRVPHHIALAGTSCANRNDRLSPLLPSSRDSGSYRLSSRCSPRISCTPASRPTQASGAFAARQAIPIRQELNTIGAALAYILNYVVAVHPNSIAVADFGHLWSLSVEEQFYLVWPIVLALVIRWRTDMVPRVIYAGIFLVVANRLLLSSNPRLDLYVRTDTRADALLIGALLVWAWTHGKIPKLPTAAPWCATAVIIVFISTSQNNSAPLFDGGFTLFAGAVAIAHLRDRRHRLGNCTPQPPHPRSRSRLIRALPLARSHIRRPRSRRPST